MVHIVKLRSQQLSAVFVSKQVHPSSKQATVYSRTVSTSFAFPARNGVLFLSGTASAAFTSSKSYLVATRRHCCVLATQKQQPEPVRGHVDEAEYEEYAEGEYDEGEWEEYEEWEENEEWEEGEEGDAEAEAVAAVMNTSKQIPFDATSVSFTPVSCWNQYHVKVLCGWRRTVGCTASREAPAASCTSTVISLCCWPFMGLTGL